MSPPYAHDWGGIRGLRLDPIDPEPPRPRDFAAYSGLDRVPTASLRETQTEWRRSESIANPSPAPNSLIYGKIQGISTDSARLHPSTVEIPERFRICRHEFPAAT